MLLDIPIRRLRQICAAIVERKLLDDLRQRRYLEWQTKILAHVTVSSSAADKDAARSMHEKIAALSVFDEDTPSTEATPDDEGAIEAMMESSIERAAARNKQGSFEQLTAGFGGP